MEDKDIVAGLFHREEWAIAELQKAYGPRLFRLASRFLSSREDAQEAVNDAYLKTWQTVPPQRPEHLFAYVAQLCRYAALEKVDWLTAQKRSAPVLELTQELSQCLPDPRSQGELEARELGEALDNFLGTLDREKRVIFLRRYWYGDPIKTIAAQCMAGESKIKTILYRLRKDLKDYLEKEGISV